MSATRKLPPLGQPAAVASAGPTPTVAPAATIAPAAPPPERVRIAFRGAVIGPGKVDGTQWDLMGRVPDDVWSGVTKALSVADPYTGIVAFIGGGGYRALEKPDPKGSVTLVGGPSGSDQTWTLPKQQDTFTPQWNGAEFRNVVLSERVRLRIDLWDADIAEDDPIGAPEIDSRALLAAKASGTLYSINVAAETSRQVLFVRVSVVPE